MENYDFGNMIPVASHIDPSYKGWVSRFFQELPSEYLSEIINKKYLILIFKHRLRDQYYAVLMNFTNIFNDAENTSNLKLDNRNDKYLRKKELTRYLRNIGY